ncbi:class II histone deacetylase [Nitratireductor sp. StC3]|uniref:class II histone deacetylase n=1 Tax=Nitratireductor sp. StC3 TaxID=2126741 RepID=UPI0018EDC266|nr:class II histone deacetylase [Nitratireductor sp. StC3]
MAGEAKLAVFWHPAVLEHDTGEGVFEAPPSALLAEQVRHPESAPRLANMKSLLERGPVRERIAWHDGRLATDAELTLFHAPAYLDEIRAADREGRRFSATTLMSKGSLRGLLAAAGTTVAALEHLCDTGQVSMALIRPPGHHAAPAMADGYCFFNNSGIAARVAQRRGLARVAVIDWDVHHGNGTQEGFYNDPDVLTVSLHMDHGAWGPTHPQTGGTEETGRGAGMGANLNLPLPMGSGDKAYLAAFDRFVLPALQRFGPDLIIVGNGQDPGQFDPNGRQIVTMAGFNTLARRARAAADRLCGGRLLVVQEGGYNPAYAAYCLHATAEGFLDLPCGLADPLAFMPEPDARVEADIAALAERLAASGWRFDP